MFSKKNINDIPMEETPHGSGSRKIIVPKSDTDSKYFDAHTYGYLPPGAKWEMHEHDNIIEICVVTKGKGVVRDVSMETKKPLKVAIDLYFLPTSNTR